MRSLRLCILLIVVCSALVCHRAVPEGVNETYCGTLTSATFHEARWDRGPYWTLTFEDRAIFLIPGAVPVIPHDGQLCLKKGMDGRWHITKETQ